MTNGENQSGDSGAQPTTAQSAIDKVDAEIAAEAGVAQAASSEGQPEAHQQSSERVYKDDDEITLDWGGATRKTKVKDLVAAARSKEQLAQQKEFIERQLEDNQMAKTMAELYASLPADKQRQMVDYLRDPTVGQRPAPQPRNQQSDDIFDLDLDDTPAPRAQESNGEVAALRRELQQMQQQLRQNAMRDQAQSLKSRIEGEIDQFSVFKDDGAARSLGVKLALSTLTANPRADVGEVVAEYASVIQNRTNSAMQNAVERSAPSQDGIDTSKLTAEALLNGGLRKQAARFLDGL